MNRGREVLVGKLAIGRRLIEREDAIRCFHQSNGEPFWEVAVRLGFLNRGQADDLVRTVDGGSLVCRGACKEIFPLDLENPPSDDRCPSCGGPLHLTSKAGAATRETWRDTGTPQHKAAVRAARAADDRDFAPTIPPRPIPLEVSRDRPVPVAVSVPAPVRPPVPASVPVPPATDSLPSAIPIKPKKQSAPTRVSPAEDETKEEPPPRPDPEGFKAFTIGTYDVLAPIGKGGMGSVFRARHKALNRIVAIKIFTSHAATDDEQQKRFDREVKTMAKLDHPGIVRVQGGGIVKEAGPYQNRPYYVMEYVAGRDLGAWAREKQRSPGECAAMIAKVCEIVSFFHDKAVIHRDLKPQNVIVSFEGDVPKICDFGLAKVEDSKLTRTGDIMGTPQFMPPEQALGEHKKVFTPTDVYSLGAILYYLLVGEPPYDVVRHGTKRTPLVELIDRIVSQAAPRPSAKNPEVPASLEAVIMKCFEKEPPRRFHNARELGTALRGLNLPL